MDITIFDGTIVPDQLLSSRLIYFNEDWFGQKTQGAPTMSIAKDTTSLWLLASWAKPASNSAALASHFAVNKNARFIEGLWKGRVAEAFLLCRSSGRYLELNLAPNGDWWAALFSGPRMRTNSLEHELNKGNIFSCQNHESVALRLDHSLITNALRGAITHANLTAIDDTRANQFTFFSLAPLPGKQPDFHQPSSFPKINEITHHN